MFKLRICHKSWIVLAPIHHCRQQESGVPARIVAPWGLSVVNTHPQSPGFLPAKCVFGRWQHPSPSTVLQGSSGEGVGGWVLSCPVMSTLCDPMDCSLPGSSVHGISQQEILEWVATPSYGIFPPQGLNPHFLHWQADSLPAKPWGKPQILVIFYLIKRKNGKTFQGRTKEKKQFVDFSRKWTQGRGWSHQQGESLCFVSYHF